MKLTPQASTRTRTSPAPGSGTSRCCSSSTSGPPLRVTTRAVVVVMGDPPIRLWDKDFRASVEPGHGVGLGQVALRQAEAGRHRPAPGAQHGVELVHVRGL